MTHEPAYDAVRDGPSGVPAPGNESPILNDAHDWPERVIQVGDRTRELRRGIGTK